MAGFWKRRWKTVLLGVLAALLLTGVLLRHSIHAHLRAMSLLVRFSDAHATGFTASFAQHPVKEEMDSARIGDQTVRYRLYTPTDLDHPAGLLAIPGIHHLGIEDPRLVALARALAGAGILVMTPEMPDLADYRVTTRSIDQIGSAAEVLSERVNHKVGVMGMSFAGGLALLAAAKPEYASHIGFVLAVGAHDDLTRVSRFFATNMVESPDGANSPFHAHEYGVLVLAYSHLEDFFPPEDVPKAQEALRLWLWEKPDEAVKAAQQLTPPGREEFDRLVHHRDQLQQKLLLEIQTRAAEMQATSPHGQLGKLTVAVFLLHGTGDTVIPAAESLWLARDVPAHELKAVLLSPALVHVTMENTVTWSQKWDLIDFMAKVLEAADDLKNQT